MATRRAEFAGSWYPAGRSDCLKAIEELKRRTVTCPSSESARVGGIVPHAGWLFSGLTACNVFQCIKAACEPDTVVLFGGHLHPKNRSYIMTEGSWETPLGDLQIDDELTLLLTEEFPFETDSPGRYSPDNTIELQLPFVKHFFPESRIVSMGVSPTSLSVAIGEKIVESAESLGRSLALIGSTDLTHYGPNYGFAPRGLGNQAVDWVKNEHDKKIIDKMLAMDCEGLISEGLENRNACCPGAAATAMAAARRMGVRKGEKLSYSTSYDTRPDASFVGYVGILF